MSIFVKPKLKALKECLAAKDWEGVHKNANAVLDFESSNYNARVFLALALFNLGKAEESEEAYRKAIEFSPSQPLARQGLASFYEKQGRWSDYARELQQLLQGFAGSQDAPKYAETLEKLLDVRRKHGTEEETIDTLSLLLPSAESYPLLRKLPRYDATAPIATTYPNVQQAVAAPLTIFLDLIKRISARETALLDGEIKKRRQRLGGPALTAEATVKQVQAEFLPQSQLPDLWRQVLNDPDAGSDEGLRRDTERRLLAHLRTTLAALPSAIDPPVVDLSGGKAGSKKSEQDLAAEQATKEHYRQETEQLARDMCVIGVPEAMAWEVEIEWSDVYADTEPQSWPAECWHALEVFADYFPESGLAQIAHVYHQSVLSKLASEKATTQGDDAGEENAPPAPPPVEVIATIVEEGLARSPRSSVTHLLAAAFFYEQEEWDAVLQVAEAGLTVLKGIEAEAGKELPRSRRILDIYLALALVHHEPPTHHLRALRLLETLLASTPPNPAHPSSPTPPNPDARLLIAKATVLQASDGKQAAALKVWDQVLALPDSSLSSQQRIFAEGERAWALHLAGQDEEALVPLEAVVQAYEERKTARDKEREEIEKYRSKNGIEKAEGIEEGETEHERTERARAWWRYGECLATSRATDDNARQRAYDAYIAALRADPSYAPAFTSLGIHYRSLPTPDWDRSSKCFQKAFELDATQEVAARHLAEEFADLSEWSLVEVIARRVVDGNKGRAGMGSTAAARLAWAWKAIGASELNSKRYQQAIVAFQAALRGAPTDVSTWIKLGVAYRHSGKHVAALKVFGRAVALEPTSWFAKYSIADVQRDIGLLEPAIETFRQLLAERPDELGIRVVLAETTLTKGLKEQKEGFVARAEASLIDALREAVAIIKNGTATRVAWKVATDALAGLGNIADPQTPSEALGAMNEILDALAQEGFEGKIAGVNPVSVDFLRRIATSETESRHFAVTLAVGASMIRVLLETQNDAAVGSAWFDLGIAISNFRSRLSAFDEPPVSADEALQQAIRCLKHALHREPLNATFWNALGVLSFDVSPRLSQHCFIRSIEHNSRSAVPWTNLGLFYLVHGDEDLANQAFLRAQVIDPDWTAAWIGQATLADLAGHAVEASVLLDHAFSLPEDVPEADIAYATRSYERYRQATADSSASDVDRKGSGAADSLSGPVFALSRYLAHRPDDYGALHLYALVLEQLGDLASAGEALEKATTLIEQVYEEDESPAVESQYIKAQTNLGRIRLGARDYQGALDAFDAALSLLDVEAGEVEGGLSQQQTITLYTECRIGSSVAHTALGNASAAVEALETAIEDVEPTGYPLCGDHLALALARTHWSEGDEDRTLSALLDSPQMPQSARTPPFLRQALLAYAIAADDTALLEASRSAAWDPATKYDEGTIRLLVLRHLAKGDHEGLFSAVSRALHASPWAPAARMRIAKLLMSAPGPAFADDDPASSMHNLNLVDRLVREEVSHAEDASSRAQRYRTRAIVDLLGKTRATKEEDGAAQEARPDAGVVWLEKAVFAAPWERASRSALSKVSPTP
ncbi:hypothetical protein JCM10908_000160 [Rhodotorula pacifica]|uniref:SKI complex subunit tetratricopeptide repeat protein SKI3 n=1 Tax=Rhodotorula pacifica TaxID=1495444 RepID=UPI0031703611